MDVLLKTLREGSADSPEILAAAVLNVIDDDITALSSGQHPSRVVELLRDTPVLGLQCVSWNQHFAKYFMVVAKTMAANGAMIQLDQLLQNVPWLRLLFGDLLILICWEEVVSNPTDYALPFLTSLMQYSSTASSPIMEVLADAAFALRGQLSVVEELVSASGFGELGLDIRSTEPEFGELFNGAFADFEETSILHAVLKFSKLDAVDEESLGSLPLITKRPKAEIIPKKVRFQHESDQIHHVLPLARNDVDFHRRRDLDIYRAYSVLSDIMSAIFRDAAMRKSSISSKKSSRLSLVRESSLEENKDTQIEDAELKFGGLYPLTFRVEILEDVFSLLFLRSSDLDEGYFHDDHFDDAETDTESVKSWSSAVKQIRDGFSCCSDGLVRRILSMLREACIQTNSERFKESSISDGNGAFHTCVLCAELPSRLSTLQQRLTDASWRLELVTHPKTIPLSINRAYTDDLVRPSFLTRKLESKKSSKRRRKKRRTSAILKKHMDTSVIEKMLADPLSLLMTCLHRGSFDLADQVLKIFGLEDGNWTQEIGFAEGYQHSVTQALRSVSPSGKQLRKTISMDELFSLPISPGCGLSEDHTAMLVATDSAIFRTVGDFSAAKPYIDEAINAFTSLGTKLPSFSSLKLPEIRPFEDFLKLSLSMAVSLDQKPPYAKGIPFQSVAMQGYAALMDEIGRRMIKLQHLLHEISRQGSNGTMLLKQVMKILKTSVPSAGLITYLNGISPDPVVTRLNFLLNGHTFLKNYATCLKLNPEVDNFELLLQSPYYALRKMLRTKVPLDEVEKVVKTMALDLPAMLLNSVKVSTTIRAHDASVEAVIILNSNRPGNTGKVIHPVTLTTKVLVNLLKLFVDGNENPYEPVMVNLQSAESTLDPLFCLQNTRISALTVDERSTFFLNLYNLLFFHANLHARCYNASAWHDNDVSTRFHFWRYRYHLGCFGTLSLQDLFDALSPLQETSPAQKLTVLRRKENGFLMANSEFVVSVKPLYSEILTIQTDLAVTEYLARSVWQDYNRNVVCAPKWLFKVYPADQLYVLVERYWTAFSRSSRQILIEPSSRGVNKSRTLRRDTSMYNTGRLRLADEKIYSSDAEFSIVGNVRPILSSAASALPLEELLPFLSTTSNHLHGLLSPGAANNKFLPGNLSSRTLLSLLFASHNGSITVDLLCRAFSESMRQGHDPILIMEAPVVRFAMAATGAAKKIRSIVISLSLEKNIALKPWLAASQIWDLDLRIKTVLRVWKRWPLNVVVEFFELMVVEDQRSIVTGVHIRVKNLETLLRNLQDDRPTWKEIFPQWDFEALSTQVPVQEIEKRIESQFKSFSAAILRLEQTEALNAWLHQSEMAFLGLFEDELQLRSLVHMLDSKPPQILVAYQLLIPMLATCSYVRIQELLSSITSPDGRLPVIRIALMSGRFNETESSRLREKEVENLILRTLPDFVRKSVTHLDGRPLLIMEQLILWNKLDHLTDILKISSLFEVFSRRLFEDMLVNYAKKAIDMVSSPSESRRSGSVTSGFNWASARRESKGEPMGAGRQFEMPAFAPARTEWTVDDEIPNCMVCGDKFGLFNRKHHCRRCGRVVCNSCSGQTIQVDIYGDNPVRACDDCFDQTIAMGSSLRSAKSVGILFTAPRMRSPNNMIASPVRAQTPRFLRGRFTSPTRTAGQQQWLLSTDEASNQRMRNEFFFDEAPDVALCIGLLKLHSSSAVAGRELLKLGNDLSEWMGSHGDCGLEQATLVNIMRTLFFKAKIFLHEDKDNGDWINVCDMYLNQLQLVELLLDAGATEIPSVQQLANLDTLRRVRDQLIQQERYALAIDLSTKSGLDPSNVWLSWGRCLLRVGKFTEAHDKLSKCLKIPVDKNQGNPPSAAALEEVMEVIQEAKMPRKAGTLGADSIIDLVLRGDILKAETLHPSVVEQENFRRMTECLHYQEMYGTHSSLLRFFVKRGLVQKALEYCLRENVSVETFMDTVVTPHLRRGELTSLEDELLMSDPTLNKWAEYLTGICKLLGKRNMNHVLLSFQLFTKDFLRAATTCVMFFQSGSASNSYHDYFDRLHYLEDAQKYLLSYLGKVAPNPDQTSKIRLQMPIEDVRRYLRTIQLQVLITQLLGSKASKTVEERRSSTSSYLPTLFGNAQAKTDLISMLVELHNTPKVEDYILNIMEVQGLNPEDTLTKVAELASKEGLKGVLGVMMNMKKMQVLKETQYDELVIRMLGQCGASSLTLASKEWESFIKQMSSDERKVDAFARARKLKSAYLLAVQMQRSDLVAFIAREAEALGDFSVQSICNRWLETHQKKK